MTEVRFYSFSDAGRFFAGAGSEAAIAYAYGWDESFFGKAWLPVVKPMQGRGTPIEPIPAVAPAAVMRVLGATKPQVRASLCLGHLALVVAGLLLGLAALPAVSVGEVAGGASLVCAGLYLAGCLVGSLAASAIVTGKMPLELLQVKE